MRIEIAVPPRRMRAGIVALARRLQRDGHATRVALVDDAEPAIPGLDLLLLLERLLYGPPRRDGLAPAGRSEAMFEGGADLVIDLTAGGRAAGAPTLAPTFDAVRGETAALSALLEGRAPIVAIVFRAGDTPPREAARGLPALEAPHRLRESRNRLEARVNDLLAQAVGRIAAGAPLGPAPRAAAPAAGSVARFALAQIAASLSRKLQRLSEGGEAWRVAWRRANGDEVRRTLAWPDAPYALLPDDGARYYADPFVFVRDGETFVFVEECPYATGRGLISVFTIAADGAVGAPRPVLEAPFHLSYPFVFEHAGAIYMAPESAAVNRLQLYRAERFPDVWVPEGALLDGVAAADATLVHHGGRWRLFATVANDGQSDWDSLAIFCADRLDGPWRSHPANPALIDARQARSAGRFFERDGRLYRPAQDCAGGYGAALALCGVDRLDDDGFAQTIEARLAPPGRAWRGVHTLNDAGGLEVIDLLGPRRAGATTVAPAATRG